MSYKLNISNMTNLRTAFCFSGQLRTWEYCYPSWIKFASKFKTPPDIFCHIWDFNSNTARITHITGESNVRIVSNEEIGRFLNIMKPKKYIIESIDKSNNVDLTMHLKIQELANRDVTDSIYWLASQFYSNMYSAFLKHEYELENGFEYDLCFRMRYDMALTDFDIHILFDKPIKYNNEFLPLRTPQPNTIYSIHSSKLSDWPWVAIGDVFYFGDSITFDKFSLFYYRLPDIFVKSFRCKKVKPENYLFFYLKSIMGNHIPIACDPKVVRDQSYEDVVKSVNQELYNCDLIIKRQCSE